MWDDAIPNCSLWARAHSAGVFRKTCEIQEFGRFRPFRRNGSVQTCYTPVFVPGIRRPKGNHIAKNRNTYAKRQREQEKRQRADDKRLKREKRLTRPVNESDPSRDPLSISRDSEESRDSGLSGVD